MSADELAAVVAELGALPMPVPVVPEPQTSGGYPPALPWAALLDAEDLADFLDELAASAITHATTDVALAEVETTCKTWRLIAEAQHGHNTAPGPDAVTQAFAPTQALRYEERAAAESDSGRRAAWRMLAQDVTDGEHFEAVHHSYRLGHDLPETGGASAPQTATVCRCDEPDADPYACEADDCTAEFSELNPFGGGGPVQGHDAKVSRTCGCGWRTSVWHVNDGSAEEELHGHVVRVHGGTYPARTGGAS